MAKAPLKFKLLDIELLDTLGDNYRNELAKLLGCSKSHVDRCFANKSNWNLEHQWKIMELIGRKGDLEYLGKVFPPKGIAPIKAASKKVVLMKTKTG